MDNRLMAQVMPIIIPSSPTSSSAFSSPEMLDVDSDEKASPSVTSRMSTPDSLRETNTSATLEPATPDTATQTLPRSYRYREPIPSPATLMKTPPLSPPPMKEPPVEAYLPSASESGVSRFPYMKQSRSPPPGAPRVVPLHMARPLSPVYIPQIIPHRTPPINSSPLPCRIETQAWPRPVPLSSPGPQLTRSPNSSSPSTHAVAYPSFTPRLPIAPVIPHMVNIPIPMSPPSPPSPPRLRIPTVIQAPASLTDSNPSRRVAQAWGRHPVRSPSPRSPRMPATVAYPIVPQRGAVPIRSSPSLSDSSGSSSMSGALRFVTQPPLRCGPRNVTVESVSSSESVPPTPAPAPAPNMSPFSGQPLPPLSAPPGVPPTLSYTSFLPAVQPVQPGAVGWPGAGWLGGGVHIPGSSGYMDAGFIDIHTPPRTHERFYFQDGNVVFKIRDVVYKVHQHYLRVHSSPLATKMSMAGYAGYANGLACNPIILDDVEEKDFDLLLSLFYPKKLLQCDIPSTSVEQWTSVLMLADKFEMTEVKAMAVEKLTPIASAVDRLALGKKYNVKEWLSRAFMELCSKKEPLTVAEGEKIGVEMLIKMRNVQISVERDVAQFLESGSRAA